MYNTELTLRIVAESFKKIGCLTDRTFGLFKHVKQETHLAEQTHIINASRCSVLQCQIPNQRGEMHDL